MKLFDFDISAETSDSIMQNSSQSTQSDKSKFAHDRKYSTVSETSPELNPFWIAKLKKLIIIKYLRISMYPDRAKNKLSDLSGLSISISTEAEHPTKWLTCFRLNGNPNVWEYDIKLGLFIPDCLGGQARHVKIQINDNKPRKLILGEVQIFGEIYIFIWSNQMKKL